MGTGSAASAANWTVWQSGYGVRHSRVVTDTVITVSTPAEDLLSAGGKLLVDFLDEFDALPDVAEGLIQARKELAADAVASKGYATLRDLRLQAGLSQTQFADAIGTSQSRVSQLEGRHQKPSEDTLRAMSAVLKVDFNTIMDALSRADT